MIRKTLYIYVLILSLTLGKQSHAYMQDNTFPDLDFEKANGIDVLRDMGFNFSSEQEVQINMMKDLYEKTRPSQVAASPEPHFPKIIHQIWIGPNPIPQSYQYYAKLWQKLHPGWEYKLWTDKDVESWDFPNKDLYYKARSYAERSDILRLEAINKFGGIYVDMDTMPLQPLDEIAHKYDYFFVLEPMAMSKSNIRIANNVIGGKPGHPANQIIFNYMRSKWNDREDHHDINNASQPFGKFKRSAHNLAVHRTMLPVTDAFFEILAQGDEGITIFPAAFFGPYYPIVKNPIRNKLSLWIKGSGHFSRYLEVHPYTKVLHLWNKEKSLINKKDFFTALFGGKDYKGKFFKYINGLKKERFAFEMLYNKNHPSQIDWSVQNRMPLYQHNICYADSCSQGGILPEYETIPWTKGVSKEPEEITSILKQLIDPQIKEFVLAAHAIKEKGGIYVSRRIAPQIDLKEISNKYNFFAALETFEGSKKDFQVSPDILAASKEHTILRNFFEDLQALAQESDSNLDQYVQKLLTENIYKYNLLDGRTLVMPEYCLN